MSQAASIAPASTRAEKFSKQGWTFVGPMFDESELDLLRDTVLGPDEMAMLEGNTQTPKIENLDEANRVYFAHHVNNRRRMMFKGNTDVRLRHPELKPLVAKAATVARELLGDEDVRILWDSVFCKPPAAEGTRPTAWHQDWVHVPLDRRGMMTIWIALYDVGEPEGCLRFVPGSHRVGPLGRPDMNGPDYDLDHLLRPSDFDLIGAPVSAPLKAGEATAHDGLLVHGAWPNMSELPRVAWTVTFIPGSTLWTGAMMPVDSLNHLGLKPLGKFDHPDLMPPN